MSNRFGHAPPRPVALTVDAAKIPTYLRRIPNWVLWKYQLVRQKDGIRKWSKVPFQTNGDCASHGDVRTWSTFEAVLDAYQAGGFDGTGLVTAGAGITPRRRDKLVLIDLDKACNPATGAIEPWAQPILEMALQERAFVEVTPSRTGFHIIGEGPQGFPGRKANNIEMYCAQRYFTMVGKPLSNPKQRTLGTLDQTIKLTAARLGIPRPTDKARKMTSGPAVVGVRPYPESWTDEDILDLAFSKHNGEKLKRLLSGDATDYGGGQSEADMGCATMLGFWFWLDASAVERVMRASNLNREKWDSKRGKVDYLKYTINRAFDGKEDYYGKRGHKIQSSTDECVRITAANQRVLRRASTNYKRWIRA